MRLLVWLALIGPAAQACGGDGWDLAALRSQRRELARRAPPLVFNNDGCDAYHFPADQPPTVENFLRLRTSDLAQSQVRSVYYCTISSGFSNFTHRTTLGTVLDADPPTAGRKNIVKALAAEGTDCLAVVIDWSRRHGREVFWSMRMNDTHDAEHRPDRPYPLFPPLKQAHPDWLVGDWQTRTKVGRWSSVDYARAEVRGLALAYLGEVCRRYDVDGVELDFFRHLCYFRSVAAGGTASDADREAMTDLLRQVRAMTEEVGLARRRPILVAIRVPDSAEYCRESGLDVPRWLEEGLVDRLATTCYFRLNPWEYSVGWGRKHGVPVYACLSEARVKGEERFKRNSVEAYRGRAAVAWQAGVDGVYLFNFFDVSSSRSPVVHQIGSPATLAGKDKLYFATVRDGNPASYLSGGAAHRRLPLLTPLKPWPLGATAVDIPLVAAEQPPAGAAARVACHLRLPGLKGPEQLAVSFNGQPLSGQVQGEWLDLPVATAQLRAENVVAVRAIDPKAKLKCADAVLSVRYSNP